MYKSLRGTYTLLQSNLAGEIRAPSVIAPATSSSHAQCASHGFNFIKIHFDKIKAPVPTQSEQRANIFRGTTSGSSIPRGNAPLRVLSHTGAISGAPVFPYCRICRFSTNITQNKSLYGDLSFRKQLRNVFKSVCLHPRTNRMLSEKP